MALTNFLIAALAAVYILFLYPLLLKGIAARVKNPVAKAPGFQPVSIVIAVHNGEKFIAQKLDSILASAYPAELMQIIVVSDGCTDDTDKIVREFESAGVELIRVSRCGKPAAINLAMARVMNEIVVLTDVRQALDPDCLRNLVQSFADPKVGVVSGEMIIRSGDSSQEGNIGLYWKFETWIRNQLASVDSMFGATGPIYAIRRELVVKLPDDILLDDVYLPMSAFFRGYRLVMERSALVFDHPSTLGSEFPRKVRTLGGNYQLLQLFPKLLSPFSNRMWLHFVSYKVGRLLLPYLLLVAAAASTYIPGLFGNLVVAALLNNLLRSRLIWRRFCKSVMC